MTGDRGDRPDAGERPQAPLPAKAAGREARRAAQLRTNLRRRKRQARDRDAGADSGEGRDDA